MSCETARSLSDNNDPLLAEHQRSCLSCMIGAQATYYEAPPGLEAKIRRSSDREVARPAHWRWVAIAASILLVTSLAANVELFRSRVSARQATVDAVFSAHVRSLVGTHLIDVVSSDQHTVKPWFNGKLDFSPPVKTMPDFPLIGGRLEYLNDHSAAALIYTRNKHIINVFMWPDGRNEARTSQSRNGYQIYSWSSRGLAFYVVSDVNAAELGDFVRLYRQEPN